MWEPSDDFGGDRAARKAEIDFGQHLGSGEPLGIRKARELDAPAVAER